MEKKIVNNKNLFAKISGLYLNYKTITKVHVLLSMFLYAIQCHMYIHVIHPYINMPKYIQIRNSLSYD